MNRVERRLLKITDELQRLAREERLILGELEMHRSLHDDASRDAAVHDTPVERENARESGKDVRNFDRALAGLRARRLRLEKRRDSLLDRLER
ncbi:MAG TPA: hypothetical protein VE669_00180 [Actinomycetota bacterium]|nr:hypothetical protein [Actinomycetota bacterium]